MKFESFRVRGLKLENRLEQGELMVKVEVLCFDELGIADFMKLVKENKKIWLASPHMGKGEWKFVKEAFDTNWIAPAGPYLPKFETSIFDSTTLAESRKGNDS